MIKRLLDINPHTMHVLKRGSVEMVEMEGMPYVAMVMTFRRRKLRYDLTAPVGVDGVEEYGKQYWYGLN